MGCEPAAEPLRGAVSPPHDGARHAGLDGGAHDRRGGGAPACGRCEADARFFQKSRFRAGRLQGAEADPARVESAAAPADPLERWTRHRLGLAAAGIFAPVLRARYARGRPAGDEMPARRAERMRRTMWRGVLLGTVIAL